MILEQVVVAGFDTYNIDVVDACLKELSTMFDIDSSQRMRRLRAMKFEMLERYDDALDILDTILEEDDSNSQARKRKIAILKAQGENGKAITELVKYLKEFMADGEAWMELCDLYILEQEHAKVYYCHAIRLNPNNMRALYGLLLTSTQLVSSPKCTTQKKKEYQKSVIWASTQIQKKYQERQKQSPPPELLDGLIGQLQIS